MAKKETPNLIFRKEWWDSLRHKSPELFKDALSILFSTYFDGKDFDPYAFDEQGSNPTPAQDLAIPMVKAANIEKDAYIAKCEKLRANISKRYSNTNVAENLQLNTNVNNCRNQSTIVGNTIQYNTIQEEYNSSLSAHTCAHEEEEREELLASLTFYFLENGVLNPYSVAQRAIQHNESMGWKVTTQKGVIYDHSKDKFSFLKGWQCEKNCYNLADAKVFADLCRYVDCCNLDVINNYRGIMHGDRITFLFQNVSTVKTFSQIFEQDKTKLDKAFKYLEEKYPKSTGFRVDVLKTN